MPQAAKQNKGSSTSMLTEEETSHEESSHVTRMTSNLSNSVLTETKEEASPDESSNTRRVRIRTRGMHQDGLEG